MVLGVVWTLRRLELLRPCPHVMACRRCNLTTQQLASNAPENTPLWSFRCPGLCLIGWGGVPVLLREALEELQRPAVRHQVQGTLALVVGIVDVGSFLRQEAGDGRAHADLGVSQKARRVQLWMNKGRQQVLVWRR